MSGAIRVVDSRLVTYHYQHGWACVSDCGRLGKQQKSSFVAHLPSNVFLSEHVRECGFPETSSGSRLDSLERFFIRSLRV